MFRSGATGHEKSGIEVAGIAPGSAADKAALRAGDVITHINDQTTGTSPHEFAHVFGAPDPIELRLLRAGKAVTVTVVPQRADAPTETPTRMRRPASDGRSATTTRIPMHMEYGKPTVDVKINGTGPWQLFMDSGAGVTVVDRELVERLGLTVTGKRRIGGPSDPEAINADVVKVDSIAVGSIELHNVEVVSWDRSDLYQRPGGQRPQGVLGLGLFADYLLSFDYPSGQIVLGKGELPAVDNEEIIPFTITGYGIPVIRISLAGKTVPAHFDTGSPGALGVPGRMEPDLKLKTEPRLMGRARTVNGEFEIRGAQLDGDLRIGGHSFENPEVLFIDALDNTNAANIGSRLLREFILTFDQRNMRVRLRRP
jgi:hypothetical protein